MSAILKREDFGVNPQEFLGDSQFVVATADNINEVYGQLVNDLPTLTCNFFAKNKKETPIDEQMETLQSLFNVADRTYQNWRSDPSMSPKQVAVAVTLLSLDLHPTLKLESR